MALPLAAAPGGVKVRVGTATFVLPLERYVAGVLAGESSVFASPEALKAMAVAARTYAVRLRGRHAAEGFDFCVTTHCQRLDLPAVTPRLAAAAAETAGELLWFEGKPAFACYTRDCGGRTENAAAVWPDLAAPYLTSHDDPYCTRAGGSAWTFTADPRRLAEALRRSHLRAPPEIRRITIARRTASGRAGTLLLEGGESIRIAAGSFRFALGRYLGWNTLPSDRYQVQGLSFEGRGSGHGVGLCQRGAAQMGLEGHSYRVILAFYYPGAEPGLTARGLSWQRLGGESVALFTTRPDRDGPLLAVAERALREASERAALPVPAGIELRVYPDLETFRNSTGEPGWVAARTRGRRIHLQPAAVLRSRGILRPTLRHEMLHILVESHASPGLPLWFREGLVGYLEAAPALPASAAPPPSDADLRQRDDLARARRAHAQATRAVAALANRYGLPAVLAWLKNSSASHPPWNSR